MSVINSAHKVMADVFVECNVEASLNGHDMGHLAHETKECRALYRVQFEESFSEKKGVRLICHFSAPDAESVRMALRCSGVDINSVWAGTIHERLNLLRANVVVEHSLGPSPKKAASEVVDDIASEWLDRYGFRLARGMVSHDCTRMIGLYEVLDTESIRLAGNEGRLPATSLWMSR